MKVGKYMVTNDVLSSFTHRNIFLQFNVWHWRSLIELRGGSHQAYYLVATKQSEMAEFTRFCQFFSASLQVKSRTAAQRLKS